MTVYNNSPHDLDFTYGLFNELVQSRVFLSVPSFTALTVPLENYTEFTVFSTNTLSDTSIFVIPVIFTNDNLNVNTRLGNPTSNSNVVLTGDDVGIARMSQFPTTLSGGNLRTSIMDSLPTGDNIIGKVVNVDSDNDEIFTQANPAYVTGEMEVIPAEKSVAVGDVFVGVQVGDGLSSIIDVSKSNNVMLVGSVDGANTFTVQYSHDGVNFFNGDEYEITTAGDVVIALTDVCCFSIRVKIKNAGECNMYYCKK